MENDRKVSAPPHEPTDWFSINWKQVLMFVGKAQRAIAQAEKDRDYRRVKRLQRGLIRSWQARALAVKRVTENRGKRTSGIDRELWDSPESKWTAIWRLKTQGYRARPLKRAWIPKPNGDERPLGIPTMLDRAMQALFHLGLDPAAECHADPNSYGFRKARSTHDAMSQLFNVLSGANGAQWILDADIKGFFDNINHDWLLANVHMNKRVLRTWLRSGVVDKRQLWALQKTEKGTPQGGVISPLLANLTLDGLERGLKEHLVALYGVAKARKLKVHLVRYADDFVVTGASPEVLNDTVMPWVTSFLTDRGLTLNTTKTKVVHVDEGFDFLGWNFRKYGGKLLIKPSRKNVKTFYRSLEEEVASSLHLHTDVMILNLNRKLRGWAEYHKGVVAKQVFTKMDHRLYWRLMRWGLRRHPRWDKYRVFRHYWTDASGRLEFNADTVDRSGDKLTIRLYRLADTKIVRHKKVREEYNPYDPAWEVYGEELRVNRMATSLWDTQRASLWLDQGGLCAHCGTAIEIDDRDMHDHHIIPLGLGGTNALSNRVLLHTVCHRQVHALGVMVTKPARV